MKQESQRQLRVSDQIRSVLSEVLHRGHFHDEVLINHAGDVTVNHVSVSPDLRRATAYVLSLQDGRLPELLEALNENSKHFQSELNRQLNIKFTPRVRFEEDTHFEEAQRIEELLQSIK